MPVPVDQCPPTLRAIWHLSVERGVSCQGHSTGACFAEAGNRCGRGPSGRYTGNGGKWDTSGDWTGPIRYCRAHLGRQWTAPLIECSTLSKTASGSWKNKEENGWSNPDSPRLSCDSRPRDSQDELRSTIGLDFGACHRATDVNPQKPFGNWSRGCKPSGSARGRANPICVATVVLSAPNVQVQTNHRPFERARFKSATRSPNQVGWLRPWMDQPLT